MSQHENYKSPWKEIGLNPYHATKPPKKRKPKYIEEFPSNKDIKKPMPGFELPKYNPFSSPGSRWGGR